MTASFLTQCRVIHSVGLAHSFIQSKTPHPVTPHFYPLSPRHRAVVKACAPTATAAADVMHRVMSQLREDLPKTFSPGEQDYSLYKEDVEFEDPLNKFRGAERHASNIRLLSQSPIFSDAQFNLHDIRILPNRSNVIRSRWTLSMVFKAVPWKPRVAFTGQSDYVIDIASGLIARHIDYWDSLKDSSYFSFPGLVDFLSQCTLSTPVPLDVLPPFHLLRRNKHFQVWRFVSDVGLVQSSDPSIFTIIDLSHGPNDDAAVVRQVAVIPLSSNRPSSSTIRETVEKLRVGVESSSFAKLADKSFCVRIDRQSSPVYHVWVQLTDALTDVDDFGST